MGRYRLESELGEGGMGSVWRATHLELGTPAAIKLVEAMAAESETAMARFRREAQAAARLRSAHVVQILDFGIDDGIPFIAMELLEGESLNQRLKRLGRLSPEETARILQPVAKAMELAHSQGIVHRDLKPHNIFLAREGGEEIVKVLDFGVAKLLSTQGDVAQLTHTGTVMGTPLYMSPEQAGGEKDIDHRSDIWSFGIIAYECLVGGRPFNADSVGGLVLQICVQPIPVPSSKGPVPSGFDAWFQRMTQRDAEHRASNIRQAGDELATLCQGGPSPQPFAPEASALPPQAQPAAQQLATVADQALTTTPNATTSVYGSPPSAAHTAPQTLTAAAAPTKRPTPWLLIGLLVFALLVLIVLVVLALPFLFGFFSAAAEDVGQANAPSVSTLASAPPQAPPPPFELEKRVPLGKWPERIAAGGGRVYVSESGASKLASISTQKWTISQRISTGRFPVGITNLSGDVYALANTARVLHRVETSAAGRERISSFATLKGCPQTVVTGQGKLWVLSQPSCHSGKADVHRFDPKRRTPELSADVGAEVWDIAAGPKSIWAAQRNGVTELSPELKVVRHIEAGLTARRVVVGESVYVAGISGVARIDVDQGRVAAHWGNVPIIALTTTPGAVFVGTAKGEVAELTPEMKLRHSYPLPAGHSAKDLLVLEGKLLVVAGGDSSRPSDGQLLVYSRKAAP